MAIIWWKIKFIKKNQTQTLNHVTFVGFGLACQMSSKIKNRQYPWERLSYFVYLLHAIFYPWNLQCGHVVLFGYGLPCPKFSELTNCQYLWKRLNDFVGFLHAVICILLDIHWSYKNMLFQAGIVRHRLSANRIVRVL